MAQTSSHPARGVTTIFRRCSIPSTISGEVPIRAIYTDYSLAKGQRSVNVVSILVRLFIHALMEK